jgi:hypothetical protein
MTFLEEVEAQSSRPPQSICKVKAFVDNQNLDDLKTRKLEPIALEDIATAKETNTIKAIHRALVNRGFEFSDKVLTNHLKGDCPCARQKVA